MNAALFLLILVSETLPYQEYMNPNTGANVKVLVRGDHVTIEYLGWFGDGYRNKTGEIQMVWMDKDGPLATGLYRFNEAGDIHGTYEYFTHKGQFQQEFFKKR